MGIVLSSRSVQTRWFQGLRHCDFQLRAAALLHEGTLAPRRFFLLLRCLVVDRQTGPMPAEALLLKVRECLPPCLGPFGSRGDRLAHRQSVVRQKQAGGASKIPPAARAMP